MTTLLLLFLVIFLSGVAVGYGLKSDKVYKQRYARNQDDKIVHELRLQRAKDYVNNPVLRQLQTRNPRDE